MGHSTSAPRLVAVSPGTTTPESAGSFLEKLRAAIGAGLPGLLLREPGLGDAEFLALGERVREIVAAAGTGAWFAIHDRPHLVGALGADAVHLGFRSLSAQRVRSAFGQDFGLGVSTHAGDSCPEAALVDYAFHGPLRPSPSKPSDSPAQRRPLGKDDWRRVAAACPVPVLALGGVTPADIPPLFAAGIHGVAVLSFVFGSGQAARATASLVAAVAEAGR